MRTPFTSRVVTPDRLTVAEVEHWDSICARNPALENPFYSVSFTRAVASVRSGVRVCVIRQANRPVAFLPFQFKTVVHQAMGAAEAVGGHLSDYFGVIASPGVKLTGSDLLRLAGLSYLGFTHLDETQLDYGLEAGKPEVGIRIAMPEGIPSFLEKGRIKNRKFFEEISRRKRQLCAEMGELTFHFQDPDWRTSLERLIHHKREQYRRTNVPDALAMAWTRKLLELLGGQNSPSCQGVLSTLYAGQNWIGSHFGLRRGGLLHYWFPVYNVEFQRFGPGKLLLTEIITAAEHLGLREIDHGTGDSMYKRNLGNSRHYYYRGAWHRRNLGSLVYRAGCSLQWRLQAARHKATT